MAQDDFLAMYANVDDNLVDEFGEPMTAEQVQALRAEMDSLRGTETETPETPAGDEVVEDEQEQTETPAETTDDETTTDDIEQPPTKPVQTPEENRRFAEERRQRQAEEKAQELLRQSPEYKLAQQLQQMYGVQDPNVLLNQLQEAQIQAQAEQQNIPVEVARELVQARQTQQQLQQQMLQVQAQAWENRVNTEAAQLQSEISVLTDDDIQQAKVAMLQTFKNHELPLKQVVYALHGEKIANHFKETERQNALAEISGRKQSTLPPQSAKSADSGIILSDEEKSFAKIFEMSDSEYAKYRDSIHG